MEQLLSNTNSFSATEHEEDWGVFAETAALKSGKQRHVGEKYNDEILFTLKCIHGRRLSSACVHSWYICCVSA